MADLERDYAAARTERDYAVARREWEAGEHAALWQGTVPGGPEDPTR